MKHIALGVSMLSLVLFSACASDVPQENMETQTETTSSVQENPGGDRTAEEGVSDEDLQLYTGAVELNDANECEKIEDQDTKDQCRADIEDKAVMDEAVRMEDESVCNQLEGQKVEVCKMEVKLADQRKEDFRDSTPQELEIMNSALESGNIQICDQLESERKKENCRTNVQSAAEIEQYYDQPQ